MPISYTWLVAYTTASLPPAPSGTIGPAATASFGNTTLRKQFGTGIRWANTPGGNPVNIVHGSSRVWHVNTLENIQQEPPRALSETGGVIRFKKTRDTRSAVVDQNIRAVYSVTGSVEPAPTNPDPTVSGSINIARGGARHVYDRLIQGVALRNEVGEAPIPGSEASYAQQLATAPSWTQIPNGLHHGYCILPLSSSRHEVSNDNAFFSGTQTLESSSIAAKGDLFYEKQTRFVTKVYKMSASLFTPPIYENMSGALVMGMNQSLFPPANQIGRDYGGGPANAEYPWQNSYTGSLGGPTRTGATILTSSFDVNASGTLFENHFHPVSGAFRRADVYNPAIFEIEVPDYGRIRDIKVWVEFIHDHRGPGTQQNNDASNPFWNPGGTGTPRAYTTDKLGLGSMVVALRPPNNDFHWGHPLWNDPQLDPGVDQALQNNLFHPGKEDYSDVDADVVPPVVPPIYRNSYLLWEGPEAWPTWRYASTVITGTTPDNDWKTELVRSDLGRLGQYDSTFYVDRKSDAIVLVASGSSGEVIYAVSGAYTGQTVDNSWHFQQIVTGSVRNIFSAYDRKNSKLHVAFVSNTDKYLYHVTSGTNGDPWNPQRVFSNYPSNLILSSLAVDDAGLCHIFVSDSTGSLRHFTTSSIGLTNEFVPFVTNQSDVLNSAYDDQGNVHIVIQGSDGNLYHVLSGSSTNGWQQRLVTASFAYPGALESNTKLRAGKSGTLIYLNSTADSVPHSYPRMLRYDPSSPGDFGNGWSYDADYSRLNVFYGDDVGSIFELAIDDTNRIHHTYITTDLDGLIRLVYVTSGSDGWSSNQMITASLPVGGSNNKYEGGIDFTSNNSPVMVFSLSGSASPQASSLLTLFRRSPTTIPSHLVFNRDKDMRVVFDDGTTSSNPRRVEQYFPDASENGPGEPVFVSSRIMNDAYPSPLSGVISGRNPSPKAGTSSNFLQILTASLRTMRGLLEGAGGLVRNRGHFMTGSNVPWMFDTHINPGIFSSGSFFNFITNMTRYFDSPPPGWITGPAGTVDVGEFPTTGSQLGPAKIQPVYPLLDDVYVEKIYDQETGYIPASHGRFLGFRPGLRGMEAHGVWRLLIGGGSVFPRWNSSGSAFDKSAAFWFRQFRIELTLDQGQPLSFTLPSKERRFTRKSSPRKPGLNRIGIISGTSNWDVGLDYIYTQENEDYGQSYGITASTASLGSQFAVFSRLTGSLADQLGESPSWLLENEFGTPIIPISSGSGFVPTLTPFTPQDAAEARSVFNQVLNPSTLISPDQGLDAFVKRTDVIKTTRDQILNKINLLGS